MEIEWLDRASDGAVFKSEVTDRDPWEFNAIHLSPKRLAGFQWFEGNLGEQLRQYIPGVIDVVAVVQLVVREGLGDQFVSFSVRQSVQNSV